VSPDDGSPKADFLAGSDIGFSFKDIVDRVTDIVVVTKAEPLAPPGPVIVYVNEAFTRISDYTANEMMGGNPRRLQAEATDAVTKRRIRSALEAKQPVRATLLNRSKDGRSYWVELNIVPLRDCTGRVTHFAAIERDITEQKRLEDELAEQARSDPLTGLFNRRAFFEMAEAEASRLRRHGGVAALLLLDIDHFKSINDEYGHPVGDRALRALAQHCRQSLRAHDAIGRIGGEEFAVLLPTMSLAGAAEVAERLRLGISRLALPANDGTFGFTVSIGIAPLSISDGGFAACLSAADGALYRAKREGRNRIAAADGQLVVGGPA